MRLYDMTTFDAMCVMVDKQLLAHAECEQNVCVQPPYEARSRIDTGRTALTRHSVGGGVTRGSFGSRLPALGGSVGRRGASPDSDSSLPAAPASRHSLAVSASPSRSTTALAPPSRVSAITRASIERLSQPKASTRVARSTIERNKGGFKGDLSASTSSIPRKSIDRGRSASAKGPTSRRTGVQASSQASTTCLSHATTDEMAESSMCESMASGNGGMDEAQSMPLTMQPASTADATAKFAHSAALGAAGSHASDVASDRTSMCRDEPDLGSGLVRGMQMLDTITRHSPSASNEQSLSSAHSVPNPHLLSPADKWRDSGGGGIPPLKDGLPALITTLDSPDVSSARSPGADKVRSIRQAYRESQDRNARQAAEDLFHGRSPAAPFKEPGSPQPCECQEPDTTLGTRTIRCCLIPCCKSVATGAFAALLFGILPFLCFTAL
jgi:hypothetical protein